MDIPYDGGVAVLAELAHVLAVKRLGAEPYEPVGWSKCGSGCGYYDYCWQRAEAQRRAVGKMMTMIDERRVAKETAEAADREVAEQPPTSQRVN